METLKTIKLSKDKLLFFLLLLLFYFFNSKLGVEIKFIALVILSIIFVIARQKFHKKLINTLTPLIGIYLVALVSFIIYANKFYDLIRDSVHLTKPIFGIILGYYFVLYIKDKLWILKAIIIFCFFSAIVHIFTITLNLNGEWDTSLIRRIGGKGSDFEAFGFALFIVFLRKGRFQLFSKWFNRLFLMTITISIVLYLSRTTFIGVLLFLISFYGLTQVTRKQVLYLLGVLVFFISFMISLQYMNIDRNSKGVESFFYKLKIAPSEIFNSDINTKDHSQLWDNWRAYEAKKAFDSMNEKRGVTPYVIGMGLGSLVDLGFIAPLGYGEMQFIPYLHNGYSYVFFKSGAIGLSLLFIWLLYLYGYIYKKTESLERRMYFKIVSGIGLYLIFSTLVITGIYNLGTTLSLFLGLSLGLTAYKKPMFFSKES